MSERASEWKCLVAHFGVSLSNTLNFYELYMIEVSLLSQAY